MGHKESNPCCFRPITMKQYVVNYPGTTSFRLPEKYFVLFYLLSSSIVLVIAFKCTSHLQPLPPEVQGQRG